MPVLVSTVCLADEHKVTIGTCVTHKFVYQAVVSSTARTPYEAKRSRPLGIQLQVFYYSRSKCRKAGTDGIGNERGLSRITESRIRTLVQRLGKDAGPPSICSYQHPRCGTAHRTPRTLTYAHQLSSVVFVRFDKDI